MDKCLRVFFIITTLLACLGCDQFSKQIARDHLTGVQQLRFFNNKVMLTRVENPGAFLSFGKDLPSNVKPVVLVGVPLVAMAIALSFLFLKNNLSRSIVVALSFVIGGGLGNIYDRCTYGAVTDFLHIDFVVFRTGIFNLADVSIVTGAIIASIAFCARQYVAIISQSAASGYED